MILRIRETYETTIEAENVETGIEKLINKQGTIIKLPALFYEVEADGSEKRIRLDVQK